MAIKPGARAIGCDQENHRPPDINSLCRGKMSLMAKAATAGATSAVPIHETDVARSHQRRIEAEREFVVRGILEAVQK